LPELGDHGLPHSSNKMLQLQLHPVYIIK
jgi:hypothetical protein